MLQVWVYINSFIDKQLWIFKETHIHKSLSLPGRFHLDLVWTLGGLAVLGAHGINGLDYIYATQNDTDHGVLQREKMLAKVGECRRYGWLTFPSSQGGGGDVVMKNWEPSNICKSDTNGSKFWEKHQHLVHLYSFPYARHHEEHRLVAWIYR